MKLAEESADLAARAGDATAEARARNEAGWRHFLLARYDEALEHQTRALALWRQLGDKAGEAATTVYLAQHEAQAGHRKEALLRSLCSVGGCARARQMFVPQSTNPRQTRNLESPLTPLHDLQFSTFVPQQLACELPAFVTGVSDYSVNSREQRAQPSQQASARAAIRHAGRFHPACDG